MKFASYRNMEWDDEQFQEIYRHWKYTAREISMKYDVDIGVDVEMERCVRTGTHNNKIKAIYFWIEGHKFGNLRDLRRALRNKAIL